MADAKRQSWLTRAEDLGRGLENLLLVVLFAGLLLLAAGQIVLRNFFSAGIPWADGLVRVLVLWLAMIGAIAAGRDNKHIGIDIVVRSLPSLAGRIVAAVICLFTASVAAAFAWQSWRFVADSREFGDVLVNGWPAWILQLILPIGFALIAYRYLVRSARNLFGSH